MSGVEDRKRDLDPETSPDADRPEEPTVSELREPSTEKEVDEEPKRRRSHGKRNRSRAIARRGSA